METRHLSVLPSEVLDGLLPPFEGRDGWLMDCTFGGGGHSTLFLKDPRFQRGKVIALDQDAEAIARGKASLSKEIETGRLRLLQCRFGDPNFWEDLASQLQGEPLLGVLADLGYSSDQVDDPNRGLSFLQDGPLDMRLDPESGMSAADWIESVPLDELEFVLKEWGEERFWKRIGPSIKERKPQTTKELVDAVVRAVPPKARRGRIHVATRSFQAIRIAVNNELGELDALLERAILNLTVGGRIGIISFHSLEDRMVKRCFKSSEVLKPLTKKPIVASDEETRSNTRARSAKLRIGEKTE